MNVQAERDLKVAIPDRIRAEGLRTIKSIQTYYEKYSRGHEDAEEMEHRISRIEAAMEGCNGLSPEDKVQKTAENLFELTCSQERSFDAMRKEIKLLRDENNEEFDILRLEVKEGLEGVIKKIEDSGSGSSSASGCKSSQNGDESFKFKLLYKLISDHPVLTLNAFIFILILVFISGHFETIAKLCGVQ